MNEGGSCLSCCRECSSTGFQKVASCRRDNGLAHQTRRWRAWGSLPSGEANASEVTMLGSGQSGHVVFGGRGICVWDSGHFELVARCQMSLPSPTHSDASGLMEHMQAVDFGFDWDKFARNLRCPGKGAPGLPGVTSGHLARSSNSQRRDRSCRGMGRDDCNAETRLRQGKSEGSWLVTS